MIPTIEQSWKILKNEHTFSEMLEIFFHDNPIKDAFLKQIFPKPGYVDEVMLHSVGSALKQKAYDALCDAKEIDPEKYFHLSSGDYFNPIMVRQFDIAIKGEHRYRFNNGEFELMY